MPANRVFQAFSGAVMLAGLVAAFFLCSKLITGERGEIQRTTQTEARQIAVRLQSGVLASIEPLERLGRWWLSQGKPLDRDDWNTDAQLFLSRSPGLREALWIGTDGYRHWLAVPGADPKVQRTRPDDRIRQLVDAAKTRRSMVVSEIFVAPNINAAFYACIPQSSDKQIRGYVVGLYDAASLISSLALTVRPDHRFTVTSAGRRIYSTTSGSAMAEENASASLEIAQQLWTVALHVPLNYFLEFKGLILLIAGVVGALVYSFGMLLYVSLRRSLELHSANAEVRALNRELNLKIADFQTLLDVTPIGIAVADDPECRNIRTNLALSHLLGVPLGVNISKSRSDADQPSWRMTRDGRELRPEELPMQRAAATGKEVFGEEAQIERADGSVIDVLSFAAPVFDEDGRVRGVLDACVDITEQKKQERLRRELEQRLQRAHRMKSLGSMAAGIAHDFNNLLTSIIGHASLAEENTPNNSAAQQHVTASLEAAHEAARLIRQVLAYTGQSFQKLRPIDLGEVIRNLHPQLVSLAAPKADVRLDIAPQLPQVLADQDEIRRVFRNLVLNAAEATVKERGTIDILLSPYAVSGEERKLTTAGEEMVPGPYVRVEIKDSGSGMRPEIAEGAFDPFFSTKFVGRGLGLSEVQGIMRAHKGAVRLVTVPDVGTSVALFFPAMGHSRLTGEDALPKVY